MNIKNKLELSLALLLFFSALTYSQCQKKRCEIVKSFFEDVFINNRPYQELDNAYSAKESNFAKSEEEMLKSFNQQIMQLRWDKEYLKDKNTNFKVENYKKSSQSDLRYFGKKARKDIFVVSVGYFGVTVPPISVKWCHLERCCNNS